MGGEDGRKDEKLTEGKIGRSAIVTLDMAVVVLSATNKECIQC